MERERKEDLWRTFGQVWTAVEAINGPYREMKAALHAIDGLRDAVVGDKPVWNCEMCEGFVWLDDERAASSEEGCHFCGDCVAHMKDAATAPAPPAATPDKP